MEARDPPSQMMECLQRQAASKLASEGQQLSIDLKAWLEQR